MSIKAARKLAAEIKSDNVQGKDPIVAAAARAKEKTFEVVLNEYVEKRLKNRTDKNKLKNEQSNIDCWLLGNTNDVDILKVWKLHREDLNIKSKRMSSITKEDIIDYHKAVTIKTSYHANQMVKWKNPNYPIYNIKYASSKDGLKWKQTGKISINLKKNERAVARPSVIYLNKKFYMWYCKENKVGQYNMGFAISKDGISWKRADNKVGIYKSKKGWDSEMIAYPNIICHQKKYFMFYNGNEYGKNGFGVAISENYPKN